MSRRRAREYALQILFQIDLTSSELNQKLKDDLGIALRYLQLVKSYNLISQKRLAMEVGNTGRNKEFYNITTFLVETECVKVSSQAQSRKILMNCTQEWADEMLVSKKPRSTPATFYRFSKNLTTTQKQKLEDKQ